MPKFRITSTHTVTEDHIIEANSLSEALKKAEDDDTGESQGEVYVEGSFEVQHSVSQDQNKMRYAVVGYYEKTMRQGSYRDKWREALQAYLSEFPIRHKFMEVLELTLSVNGNDAEPVWEDEFCDYIADNDIQVRNVRDPRISRK